MPCNGMHRGQFASRERQIMTDRELQEHIQSALDWEPSIDAADIGVSVDAGVVTLRADVRSYSEKAAVGGTGRS